MTSKEEKVLDLLADAWNAFLGLTQCHEEGGCGDDTTDFRFHLHALQNLVAARTGFREDLGKRHSHASKMMGYDPAP